MLSSVQNNNGLPVMDETLVPITVGRRDATPQETRAIAALNAVLDDQPGPPKTLFDYTGNPNELRRTRPAVNRMRVKAATSRANEVAGEALIPALMVDVRVFGAEAKGEDYTPAMVAPEFTRDFAHVETGVIEADLVSTRDEALAIAREVEARVDIHGDAKTVEKAVGEVMMADMMPFGNATMRLFCC